MRSFALLRPHQFSKFFVTNFGEFFVNAQTTSLIFCNYLADVCRSLTRCCRNFTDCPENSSTYRKSQENPWIKFFLNFACKIIYMIFGAFSLVKNDIFNVSFNFHRADASTGCCTSPRPPRHATRFFGNEEQKTFLDTGSSKYTEERNNCGSDCPPKSGTKIAQKFESQIVRKSGLWTNRLYLPRLTRKKNFDVSITTSFRTIALHTHVSVDTLRSFESGEHMHTLNWWSSRSKK